MTSHNQTASAVPALHNAFTVDVEDYFHVQAFAGHVSRKTWHQYESRVEHNTHRILHLLDKHQVQATFFILGWVAEKHPALIRDIQHAGHEIGCHSYWHRLVFDYTPDEFRHDLRLATQTISHITGEPVTAYRAPCFSITKNSLWALDVLIDEGYRLDSSIFPVRHDTYGFPDANPAPHVIHRPGGSIAEFPPAVRRKWFANIPVAGGGYFRHYPLRLSMHWLRNINRKEGRPFVFYIHPWELDPAQPRMPAGLKSRFRHYRNLHATEDKLDRLLASFRFGGLETLAAAASSLPAQPKPELEATAHNVDALDDTALDVDVTDPKAHGPHPVEQNPPLPGERGRGEGKSPPKPTGRALWDQDPTTP